MKWIIVIWCSFISGKEIKVREREKLKRKNAKGAIAAHTVRQSIARFRS